MSADGRGRVAAPDRRAAARGRGLPGGRAALFLASSVFGSGCADEPSIPDRGGPNEDSQNDGGDAAAGRDGGADASQVMGGPVYGVAIDSGVISVPPYGIAIPPDAGPDATVPDASCPRFGNLPAPVYGIPVDSGTRNDVCTDAGHDAGIIAVPPYGVAPDQ